ncbi:benzoate 4-monooxygenase cytochrome P450 [Cladophialophora carrionii]|uniref:Benzoate 4-monooxygenase cytochrome P450 n=1 Tax=Cladophialophora carrionii TaxID=86049 RepID=A0A1C1CHK6_9EURO|nr:benzoate 4-monooxygenase cytochrome P450 [Cladophialophora carrionii]
MAVSAPLILQAVSPLYLLAGFVLSTVVYLFVQSKRAKLDHIPGPVLAKYSNIWRGYRAWRLNHHTEGVNNYQIQMIGQYGDVVRIGPKHVLVYDPEAIDTIYGFRERLDKGPGYQVFVMTGTDQTALVSIKDEKTHGMYRRPIAHAYSLSSLKGYEPYIDQMIEKLIGELDKHDADGTPINMTRWLQYWAFDVMSKISFGEPIGFLDHGDDFNGMIQAQRENFRYISVANNFPFLDTLTKRNPLLKLFKKKPSMFFTFARRVVNERLARAAKDPESQSQGGRHEDLLGSFIAARKSYPLMTDIRITHITATNVLAGANNSARAMDATIHWLTAHPEAQERLYSEIKSVNMAAMKEAETEGPAALELALKMPYLDAVIQESYRQFGAPANNLERLVGPAGLTLPNGVQLPPGTVVCMNAASMSMLPHVFGQDARVFNPDRWMQQRGESDEAFHERRWRMQRAMIVFGHGSRSCIGKNIVQLELYKIWATLLRIYKLHQVMTIPRRREKKGGKAVEI